MGFGDEIMASGLARDAAARTGKLIAFGDGKKIIWSDQSRQVFENNPHVAPPGTENNPDLEWIPYYRGKRFYGEVKNDRWKFRDWTPPKGQIFFSTAEREFGFENLTKGWPFVVIEPRVKLIGACAGANKQWPIDRYAAVAKFLAERKIRVVQFVPKGLKKLLSNVEAIETANFRSALAVLSGALLYIGPEGGLHHGAAAVGTDAVVIFGGFNSPKSTGYEWHENLAVGEPCGNIKKCEHCRRAMESISVEQVLASAKKLLQRPMAMAV